MELESGEAFENLRSAARCGDDGPHLEPARTSVNVRDGSCLRTGVPCTLRPRPVVQRERLAEDAA